MTIFNILEWLTKIRNKNSSQSRVFEIWEEIEECQKVYQHKKSLGDQLIAQADEVDNLQLSLAENVARKEIYFKAAKEQLDKAAIYNRKIADLLEELKLAIKDARR